jgi:hypothetical protein
MQKLSEWKLIVFILLFSCKSNTVIPEKDMVSILVKVHITDATITSSDLKKTFFEKDTIDYYGKIYQQYGYTSAQFDSSFHYYSKDPKKLDAIYDKVIFELSRIQTDLIQNSKKDSSLIDTTKNIWPLNYNLSQKDKPDLIPFEIPVVGLGVYTLSYDIQVFPDDESVDPQLKVYFYYDNNPEKGEFSQYTTIPYIKSGLKKSINVKMELKNSLVTHIKGTILNRSNPIANFRSHATISDIKLRFNPAENKNKKNLKKIKPAS